jgi:hypothetical protein
VTVGARCSQTKDKGLFDKRRFREAAARRRLCGLNNTMDFPLLIFVLSFVAFWLSTLVGASLRKRRQPPEKDQREDLVVVQGAALTLLTLLIGFTFSMAMNRYELRKNYEEAEANAIGTEYVRAGLLPDADTTRVHELLGKYLDQRVLFYTTRDPQRLQQVDTDTTQLQNQLWSTVQARALAQPNAMSALAASGMNDVLNSQGYTQAAWWNRIPLEAWVLLAVIAIGCNMLIGYGAHRQSFLSAVLPLAVSLSFFLIADIDSPRGGLIRVRPVNLVSLSQTLRSH